MSRATAAVAALLLVFSATPNVHGQSSRLCEGELGQIGWACDSLAPIPAQVFDGADEFLVLPGSPDPANPTKYKQIAGAPVTFDEVSGERIDNNAAVFVLTEGAYFCMVAESNGEAALFDAPEGMCVLLKVGRKRVKDTGSVRAFFCFKLQTCTEWTTFFSRSSRASEGDIYQADFVL